MLHQSTVRKHCLVPHANPPLGDHAEAVLVKVVVQLGGTTRNGAGGLQKL